MKLWKAMLFSTVILAAFSAVAFFLCAVGTWSPIAFGVILCTLLWVIGVWIAYEKEGK